MLGAGNKHMEKIHSTYLNRSQADETSNGCSWTQFECVCSGRASSHQQAILRHQQHVQDFSWILTLSHIRVPQNCPPTLQTPVASPVITLLLTSQPYIGGSDDSLLGLQTPVERLCCYLHLQLTDYESKVSTTLSLGLINLLEWLRGLRNTCLLTGLPVYCKRNSGTARRKRRNRANYGGRGGELPCPLQKHHCPCLSTCSPTPLRALSFWVFIELSFHRHDY